MRYKNVFIEEDGPLAVLTIDRPDVRNALDPVTVEELKRALKEIEQNSRIRVLIITGSGEKAFVSGADIRKLRERTSMESLLPGMQGLNHQVERLNKPVIAAINGYALGGGCELAMACDIRIAAEHAKLGLPELSLGIIPGGGGTQRLVDLVGKGKAKELIYTGAIVRAEEAEEIGLVNRVVPKEELIEKAKEMAEQISKKGPVALYMAKKAIDIGTDAPEEAGMLIEKLAQSVLMSTEDKREGTSAFLEKRPPRFQGK